jgi:two-component system response regulator YesN
VQLENELMDYSSNGLKLASATAFRILMLASSSSSRLCQKNDYVELAKQIIDSQFCNPELNIGMLADKLQVNRSQLCRKFHAAYGVSPVRYLINCRVQFGLELIENSNDKIMEIAAKSGFGNPNYFSKSIKKYTGIPLRQFRG